MRNRTGAARQGGIRDVILKADRVYHWRSCSTSGARCAVWCSSWPACLCVAAGCRGGGFLRQVRIRRGHLPVARRDGDDLRERVAAGARCAARLRPGPLPNARFDASASRALHEPGCTRGSRVQLPAAQAAATRTSGSRWTTSGSCGRRRRSRGRRSGSSGWVRLYRYREDLGASANRRSATSAGRQ